MRATSGHGQAKPRPWVLMNQTPHIHAHTLMINPCPLPPGFLLAVLYANPNSRVGCLRPLRSHYGCVCGCIWSLKHTMEALHWATSMPIQTVALPTHWVRHTGGRTQHQRSTAWQMEWQSGKEIPDWHWSQDWRSRCLLMSDYKENQCHKGIN